MRSSKKSKDPRSGIAERDWPVYERYEIGSIRVPKLDTLRNNTERIDALPISFDKYADEPAIIKTGEQIASYSLSDPNTYNDLFEEYCNIYTTAGALAYVKRRGFPHMDIENYPPLGKGWL